MSPASDAPRTPLRAARGPAAPVPGSVPVRELQAVLFDMDGLLVDSEPLWFEVESQVMTRLGGRWEPSDQQALVGGSLERTVSYLLARAVRPASPDDVGRWLVDTMVAVLGSAELAVLPGALELLAEVRAAGLPHALVTSSERKIMDAILGRIGVCFGVTVCAEDVRRSKPDPEPYLLAAARLRADPRRCVALEDSPNGVAAAEAAGCVLVAVPSLAPVPAAPGRVVAGSLTEISLDRLRAMVRASADPDPPAARTPPDGSGPAGRG